MINQDFFDALLLIFVVFAAIAFQYWFVYKPMNVNKNKSTQTQKTSIPEEMLRQIRENKALSDEIDKARKTMDGKTCGMDYRVEWYQRQPLKWPLDFDKAEKNRYFGQRVYLFAQTASSVDDLLMLIEKEASRLEINRDISVITEIALADFVKINIDNLKKCV